MSKSVRPVDLPARQMSVVIFETRSLERRVKMCTVSLDANRLGAMPSRSFVPRHGGRKDAFWNAR